MKSPIEHAMMHRPGDECFPVQNITHDEFDASILFMTTHLRGSQDRAKVKFPGIS
jgi:hypothetical protein